MGRPPADEIQILRYFETEPLEKADLLYKIVSEKMRERLRDRRDGALSAAAAKETVPAKRNQTAPEQEPPKEPTPAKLGS